MKYTLITARGRVMTFYVLAVAELYRTLEGGVLITDAVYAEAYGELLVDE